jgi:hypothetical protein
MRDVGNRDRKGWQDLPDCQSCHTGDAIHNAGELRYTTAFDASGKVRKAVDPIFATNANVPSAGLSLYSASKGHGNLQCAACHGTQHAEYPSGQGNDNLQPRQIQGHGGSIADCASCHPTAMNTVTGGPHTMHPVGNDWVRQHRSVADDGPIEGCRTCHGADDRGTVLSRMLGERRMQGGQQQTTYWQGFQIGCYNCHNGPRTEQRTGNRAAQVKDAALTTDVGKSVATDLVATDADGDKLTLRIVTQPDHGTVALADRHATYLPEPGWTGNTRFTFAAWDNSTDSNLGTVRIQVGDALPVPTDTAVLPPTRVPSPTVVPSRTPLPPSTPTPGTPAEPSPTGRPTAVPRPSSTPGVMVGRILLPIVRRGAR